MASPLLWLARHGSTEFNDPDPSKDRIRGWLNIPLDEEGVKEAVRLGKFFDGKGVRKIYASDLGRTMETAEKIKEIAGINAEIIPTKALRPWHLGDMEGEVVAKILPQMKYYAEHPYIPVPGGETFNDFLHRLLPFVRDRMNQAEIDKKPVLLVSHYRDLKAVDSWIKDGMKGEKVEPDKSVSGKLATGVALEICKDGKKWTSSFVND